MFATNASQDITRYVETFNGRSYLGWASALALAGRPPLTVATFAGRPVLPLFGGVLVAVDTPLPNGEQQRTWLPILDGRNEAIPLTHVSGRDVSDTIQRCRAKTVAMVAGVGLSVYSTHGGKGQAFVKELGVSAGSDLAAVPPLVRTRRAGSSDIAYIDWQSALAAARITDDNFHWAVGIFDTTDKSGAAMEAVPVCRVGSSWFVRVDVTYKNTMHSEWLPIMTGGNKAATSPDVGDWNTAVMRCLTKAIAVVSGYGLTVYAGEDTYPRMGDDTGPAPAATGTVAAPAAAVQAQLPVTSSGAQPQQPVAPGPVTMSPTMGANSGPGAAVTPQLTVVPARSLPDTEQGLWDALGEKEAQLVRKVLARVVDQDTVSRAKIFVGDPKSTALSPHARTVATQLITMKGRQLPEELVA